MNKAAHVKKVDSRNADYWRIISELEAQAPPRFFNDKNTESIGINSGEKIIKSMDHVIIAGDLNYRLDLPRELAERTVSDMESSGDKEKVKDARNLLLRHDQLLRTISEGRAFPDFAEGEIKFSPTFKFDKGTNDYDTSYKQRIPAWTDRILFTPCGGVKVHDYDSADESLHSDHRPVHATLLLNMNGKVHAPKQSRRKKRRKKRTVINQS